MNYYGYFKFCLQYEMKIFSIINVIDAKNQVASFTVSLFFLARPS